MVLQSAVNAGTIGLMMDLQSIVLRMFQKIFFSMLRSIKIYRKMIIMDS